MTFFALAFVVDSRPKKTKITSREKSQALLSQQIKYLGLNDHR